MTSKIEQVARAIELKRQDLIALPLNRLYKELAKAAIAAMREPTKEMKEAYRKYASELAYKGEYMSFTYGCAVMIDAALKEE